MIGQDKISSSCEMCILLKSENFTRTYTGPKYQSGIEYRAASTLNSTIQLLSVDFIRPGRTIEFEWDSRTTRHFHIYATNLHKTLHFVYVSFLSSLFLQLFANMCDEHDVLAASAAFIVVLSATNVALLLKRRRHRFWVWLSLLRSRKKYSATDFMRNVILDDQNLLSLEYHSGAGFRNFFQYRVPHLKKFSIWSLPEWQENWIHNSETHCQFTKDSHAPLDFLQVEIHIIPDNICLKFQANDVAMYSRHMWYYNIDNERVYYGN